MNYSLVIDMLVFRKTVRFATLTSKQTNFCPWTRRGLSIRHIISEFTSGPLTLITEQEQLWFINKITSNRLQITSLVYS